MSAPPVRIRIGGAIDSSLATSLRSAAQMVGQAEKAIQQKKRETTRASQQEARNQLKAQEAMTRAVEALDRQRSRALYQQHNVQVAAAERAAKAQERSAARAHAAERREIEKTVQAAQRAFEREAREAARRDRRLSRRSEREGESFARRTSHRASRFLMPEAPIGPMVMRGLGDVARGAGVDFSIQGMVGRNVSLQQQATDLSNSGYQAGAAGPNGQRVDPAALTAQARAVGGQFGIDASEVLGGLVQYQKIAGDLDTGRQNLFAMAALSKATGTNLADMAAATANVSNGLGDVPNKARIIDEVMRTIAGQGKLGAVEISDMATQMARIAAAAGNFGGDRAKNIQQFGALAQIARAQGGAPSAAEAARSMGGFANTFKKSARNKEFTALTKESAFTDETNTKLRDPIDLIKTALKATGGDQLKMNKIFMDVVGGRTVTGLANAYTGAGGGDAGLKAVDELIGKMMKAQISQDEVNESAKRASETTAAKAARFQNSLDAITESTMKNLVPAMEKAGPAILKFAEVIGSVTTWAVENPKLAIAGAISTAIARAGIESAFRTGIERLILGPTNAEGVGARAGGVGALAGKVGGALTLVSLAVTTLTVGKALIDSWFVDAQKEQSDAVAKGMEATNLGGEARVLAEKGDVTGAIAKQKESIVAKEQELAQTQGQKPGFWMKLIDATMTNADQQEALKSRDAAIERAAQQQIRELAEARSHLARLVELGEQNAASGGAPPARDSQ